MVETFDQIIWLDEAIVASPVLSSNREIRIVIGDLSRSWGRLRVAWDEDSALVTDVDQQMAEAGQGEQDVSQALSRSSRRDFFSFLCDLPQ